MILVSSLQLANHWYAASAWKSLKSRLENYHPISIHSMLSKVMDAIFYIILESRNSSMIERMFLDIRSLQRTYYRWLLSISGTNLLNTIKIPTSMHLIYPEPLIKYGTKLDCRSLVPIQYDVLQGLVLEPILFKYLSTVAGYILLFIKAKQSLTN